MHNNFNLKIVLLHIFLSMTSHIATEMCNGIPLFMYRGSTILLN